MAPTRYMLADGFGRAACLRSDARAHTWGSAKRLHFKMAKLLPKRAETSVRGNRMTHLWTKQAARPELAKAHSKPKTLLPLWARPRVNHCAIMG